jgi:predicted 2-oxoglutarate/Fe(II)-dependent dioxygenase YbiX
MIEIQENLLTEHELNYVNDLIKNESKWVLRAPFNQKDDILGHSFFDSIHVDNSKLEEYSKKITNNGEYEVVETAINIITPDRQLKDSKHYDMGDLSFVTYLNDNFEGGKFCYNDDKNEEVSISPYVGLCLKINSKTLHWVSPVTNGIRFSLYTFLQKIQKKNKTLL